MKSINRVGEEGCNTFGTLMKIIECKNAHSVVIEFQDKYKVRKTVTYQQFLKGNIKNPDEYKDLIPQKLYEALYNYEVEIND